MGNAVRRVATAAAIVLAVSGCGTRLNRSELEAANGLLAPVATVEAPEAATPESPDGATVSADPAVPIGGPTGAGRRRRACAT
ncbi:MAG: hypothetical protein ACRDZ3_19160 [Acidimicrobiia bacterium]